MSALAFFMICLNPLIIQRVSTQYLKKRNTYEPVIAAGVPYAPYPYCDIDTPPYMEPYYPVPAIYIPESAYVSEYPGPTCERTSLIWPDYRMASSPFPGGFGNLAVQSAVAEEIVTEAPTVTPSPLIKAVGFGGDALALALTPLLEAADADVALLMFTKVKSC